MTYDLRRLRLEGPDFPTTADQPLLHHAVRLEGSPDCSPDGRVFSPGMSMFTASDTVRPFLIGKGPGG